MTRDPFLRRTAQAYRNHQRRARQAGAVLDYDLEALRNFLKSREPRCIYCHGPLTPGTFAIDHFIPVARGGSWALANLAYCCIPCNEAKGALTGGEYQILWEAIRRWPVAASANVLKRLRAGGKLIRTV